MATSLSLNRDNSKMNIKKSLKKTVFFFENTSLTFGGWLLGFVSIVASRFYLEELLLNLKTRSLESFLGVLLHSVFLFFLFSYLVILVFIKVLTKERLKKIAAILLWGEWIILLPPLIDKAIFRDSVFWSFYILDGPAGVIKRFFLFFGDHPAFGITYGTRIEVVLVVLMAGGYLYYKKKKLSFALMGALGVYFILFLLGVFPSILAIIIETAKGKALWLITKNDVSQLFLSPLKIFGFPEKSLAVSIHYKMSLFYNLLLFGTLIVLQWIEDRKKLWSLIRNTRFPQIVFNSGLLLTGIAIGAAYFKNNLTLDLFSFLAVANLLLAVLVAWLFAVVWNDINDLAIDKVSNPNRPLPQEIFSIEEYQIYAIVFLVISLSASLTVGPKFFLLFCAYHFLTWAYSSPPFRLKRWFPLAILLASFSSLIYLIMGFVLLSNGQNLIGFPWEAFFSLLFIYGLVLSVKDFKDMTGDQAGGVITLPILLGEDNARLVVGSSVLFSFLMTVYVVHEQKLFLPALLAGGAGYWIVNNKKISPRHVYGWLLLVVFFYVMLALEILLTK